LSGKKLNFLLPSLSPVGRVTTSFDGRHRRVYRLLMILLLLFLFSTNAHAAFDGLVARSEEGCYHRYCYEELLDSYAQTIMGRSDALYEDYLSKTPVAVYTNGNGYLDYNALLDRYAVALKNGEAFDLATYLQSEEAEPALIPNRIMLVSLSSGAINRDEIDSQEADLEKNDPVTYESCENEPEKEPKKEPEKVSESAEEKGTSNTMITGSAEISKDTAIKWAKSNNAHQRFIAVSPLYWEYGDKSGIRPEILYAQAAHETGFGRYSGIVPPEYNNWAGIKTATANGDRPEDHEQFASAEDGVRAHFNHMSAYIGLSPIGATHDRYDVVKSLSWAGTVEIIEDLSGKWAPSSTYHERIVNMIEEMYRQE